MKKRILLADDDESVRRMVARVLESAGYAVMLAGTGAEAVSRFEAVRADLVLLDLKMPDEEGWAGFEQISRVNGMAPVIVMTAWPNQYERAVRRGVDALMEKPLDLPLLLQTIHKLLADRNSSTAHLTHAGSAEPGGAA
jgi:DNA-binding response OmpR family regulator